MTRATLRRIVPVLLILAPLAIWMGVVLRRPQTSAPEQTRLRVTVINVGQGEASLIRTPGGATILIGAGPTESGSNVVESLQSAGVKQIDLLILPYSYAESSGGLPEVHDAFDIKTVLEPGGGGINAYITPEMRGATEIRIVRAGSEFLLDEGDVKLEVIAPDSIDGTREVPDDSLVVSVKYKNTRFLFAGGIGAKGERALLARTPYLRADWLRVARSGAGGSSSPEFLRLVRPEFAVVSVGPNGEGFPAPSTMTRLQATGARLFRTDENGGQDITFWSDGREVTQGSGKL